MDDSVWEIAVSDRVLVNGVHAGVVVLGAKSRARYLVRIDGGMMTDSGYILSTGRELQRQAVARRRDTSRRAMERRAA